MKICGIIAEFNPFHNGHQYFFQKIRETGCADKLIVIMSGAFTQRGEPAFMHKYDRVKAALMCGADAVLELPIPYAASSAETFAYGGVSLLDALNTSGYLCFGAETDDMEALKTIAGLILNPTEELKSGIDEALQSGASYPAARAGALPRYSGLLSGSNNILAIEYLKALKSLDSGLTPLLIKRTGAGYLNTDIRSDGFASAAGIRKAITDLYGKSNAGSDEAVEIPEDIAGNLPPVVLSMVRDSLGKTCPVSAEDLRPYLIHQLIVSKVSDIACLQDMNSDLANRFINAYISSVSSGDRADTPNSLTDLLLSMRTKEITYTRLSRAALKIVLNQKDLTRDEEHKLIGCPYTRLLGFRKDSSDLVHRITHSSSIPVITKAADAKNKLGAYAYAQFEQTVMADRFYDSILYDKFGYRPADTYLTGPLII